MLSDFVQQLNTFGALKEPFFFAINFEQTHFIVHSLKNLPSDILYTLNHRTNAQNSFKITKKPQLKVKSWIDKEHYKRAFQCVKEEIRAGNTYLLNLSFPTSIELDATLEEVFYATKAPFKCCIKGHFVCFSPERFIKIEHNQISTYPMKGTIDASIENAQEIILNDEKEMAEHVMVVDLLRNDLGMVSTGVQVEKFRYVERLKAKNRELLQVSSKITGNLDERWHERIGEIIATLLPAGSISGTPKKRSVEIIQAVEQYERGYFTGIFGVYDGKMLDSAVMIRYIEQTSDGLVFKSGGGITLLSDEQKEYDELCTKVYIPLP